jgi:hypothetical protein
VPRFSYGRVMLTSWLLYALFHTNHFRVRFGVIFFFFSKLTSWLLYHTPCSILTISGFGLVFIFFFSYLTSCYSSTLCSIITISWLGFVSFFFPHQPYIVLNIYATFFRYCFISVMSYSPIMGITLSRMNVATSAILGPGLCSVAGSSYMRFVSCMSVTLSMVALTE